MVNFRKLVQFGNGDAFVDLVNGFVDRSEFHHLCSFGALPFLKAGFFFPMVEKLDRLDGWLFARLPALGWLSWYSIIAMEQPRRGAAHGD